MVWSSVARHLKTNLARAPPSFLAWGFEMEGVFYEQRERIDFIFTLAVYPVMPIALLPLDCPSQLFRGGGGAAGVAYGQMERIANFYTFFFFQTSVCVCEVPATALAPLFGFLF